MAPRDIAFFAFVSQHPLMRSRGRAGFSLTGTGIGRFRPICFFGSARCYGIVFALWMAFSACAAGSAIKVDLSYQVTLAGLSIGEISARLDLSDNQYLAVAKGGTHGLFRVIANGHGEIVTRGIRARAELLPSS